MCSSWVTYLAHVYIWSVEAQWPWQTWCQLQFWSFCSVPPRNIQYSIVANFDVFFALIFISNISIGSIHIHLHTEGRISPQCWPETQGRGSRKGNYPATPDQRSLRCLLAVCWQHKTQVLGPIMPGFVSFLAGCIAVNFSYTTVFFLYFYSQFFESRDLHSVTKLNLFTTYRCINKGNK